MQHIKNCENDLGQYHLWLLRRKTINMQKCYEYIWDTFPSPVTPGKSFGFLKLL